MSSRMILALCGLLAAFLPVGLVSNAQPDGDHAKHQLLAIENEWLKSEGDPQALEHILADDFVHALPSGFITKQDQIGFVRTHHFPPDNFKRHFEALRVRVYGTAGIVNGIVVATNSAGATVKRTVFTDVFAYRSGHWQAVNAQENEFKSRND